MFLESFRVYHSDITFVDKQAVRTCFGDVYNWEYVEKHGDKAVALIKDAFDTFKATPTML